MNSRSRSHFVATHRCALQALQKNAYDDTGVSANQFHEDFMACSESITALPDPRYRVFFSPDPSRAALSALIQRMKQASTSVSMAIQHFSAWPLASQLSQNGATPGLLTRLVLDDDTFYGTGESGEGDSGIYNSLLKESQVQTRFLQTKGDLEYGSQYQHNKYVLIDDQAVFCGAGNFTGVAFADNYENFYLLEDPRLAAAYAEHFQHLFDLAKPEAALPASVSY